MSNSNQFAGGLVDNAVIQTTDWSKQILDHFFGSGWNLLTPSPLPDGSSLSLIFDILGPINVVALAIGSIILTWAFVKSVLDTANQGEAFGKQGLWGPIRSALAVALMAPLGKGLCALQILILLLIAGSINFANVIWSTGLDFMAKHDGQMVVEVPASIESNTERLAYGVLQSMAFQGFYNHVMGKGCVIGGKTISKWRWAKTKDTGEGYWLLTFHLPSGSGLSEGDMGRIIIRSTTETSKLGIARKAQVEALITRLKPYAKKIASIVSDEIAAPSIEGILVYEKTINLFNEAMLPHLKEIVASTKPEFDKSLEVFVNSAKLNGWLSAGPYYRTISGYAERNQKIMKSYPRYLSPNIRKIQVTTNKQFDALCKRLEAVEKADDIETHIASASDGKEKGSVTKIVNKLFYASFGKWGMNTITNCLVKGDPIGNLTSLGHKMISASTLMFVTGVTARAAATAAVGAAKKTWWGRLANMVSGVGDILEDVTNGFFEGIWPLFMVVLMALYSQGVLLAYYLPMVPFMFWWLAVVGWFILVIEALFAAPIWAAAHAIPDGRGLINAHAKPGYKLLLGVLLRPPLMVSGFLVAMVLITKIGNILGEAFKLSFGTGVAANHMVGPVGVLILTILLSMFLIAICQKIFGLVTHLPDSVIKWVGGVGRNLGESGDLHRIQDSFSGAMDKGEQGTGDLNRGPQKSKTKGKKGFKSKKKT